MTIIQNYTQTPYPGGEFKLSLRTKDNHSPDEIKRILKTKVNPTEIHVGLLALKTLKDGRILIEAGSKK
jgi:hypothetical protein